MENVAPPDECVWNNCTCCYNRHTQHSDNHGILVDCQHGFRRKRLSETQLLITSHDLAEILNNHSQAAAVAALDFSKAFDKVPHYRLLLNSSRPTYCNLDSHVIGWVESFLSSLTQRVVVDGFTLQEAPVRVIRSPWHRTGSLIVHRVYKWYCDRYPHPSGSLQTTVSCTERSSLCLTAASYNRILAG